MFPQIVDADVGKFGGIQGAAPVFGAVAGVGRPPVEGEGQSLGGLELYLAGVIVVQGMPGQARCV